MISVGIDARPLIFTRAGIHTYVARLIPALAAAGGCRLRLFVPARTRTDWQTISGSIKEDVVRLPQLNGLCERFWQDVLLPRAVRRSGVALFHGPRFFLPRKLELPAVVTIHDLAFKKFGGLVAARTARMFDTMTSEAVSSARRIIVPSQATADDLAELYPASRHKTEVVHEAASLDLRHLLSGDSLERLEQQRLKKQLGIRGRFILSVGTIEPRKNYCRLLEAYALLPETDRPQLVICGGWGWLYKDVLAALRNLGLEKQVIFAGYLADADLVRLYSICDVFVFPSLYEGFGLPVLESLQCGAAAVVSDIPAFKELFAGECRFVDPLDSASIAAGIGEILADPEQTGRLRRAAKARAAVFSWEKTAAETLGVYRQALEG